MAKISHFYDKDFRNRDILILQKSRGKLNLDEITNYLLYEAKKYGKYIIVINASESACEGSGWGDEEEKQGDTAILYEVLERDDCPICGGVTPFQYCYHCGKELND